MEKSEAISVLVLLAVSCLVSMSLLQVPRASAQPQCPIVLDNTGATRFYWLIVGQNDGDLQYAKRDARIMDYRIWYWWEFMPEWGYDCCRPLAGSTHTELENSIANKTAIMDWFTATRLIAQPGDSVIFFFSGHGNVGMIFTNEADDQILSDKELSICLSGFRRGVTFTVILDSCYSYTFVDGVADDLAAIRDENGHLIDHRSLAVITSTSETTHKCYDGAFTPCLAVGLVQTETFSTIAAADTDSDGIVTAWELWSYGDVRWFNNFFGDNDHDGRVDEDDMDYAVIEGVPVCLRIDDDNDGLVDEDASPRYSMLYPPRLPVGGISVAVKTPDNDFAPFVPVPICAASAILVKAAAKVAHAKYVKRGEEKRKNHSLQSNSHFAH